MTDLPRTSKPAQGALSAAGYTTLEDVAGLDADVLLSLHGVGPSAIRILDAALAEHGLPPLRARRPRSSVNGGSD